MKLKNIFKSAIFGKTKSFGFCSVALKKSKKYTFKDIDNLVKQIKDLRMSIDNLPDELKNYQKEIIQIMIIPNLDEESCCGSNCTPCVRESIVDNEIKYNEYVNDLIEKLNNNLI
jgi:hypothetical protein